MVKGGVAKIKEIGEEEETIGAIEETVPDVAETPVEVRAKIGEVVRDTQSTGALDTPPIHLLSAVGPIGFTEARRDGARTRPHVRGRISPHLDNEKMTSSELQK